MKASYRYSNPSVQMKVVFRLAKFNMKEIRVSYISVVELTKNRFRGHSFEVLKRQTLICPRGSHTRFKNVMVKI